MPRLFVQLLHLTNTGCAGPTAHLKMVGPALASIGLLSYIILFYLLDLPPACPDGTARFGYRRPARVSPPSHRHSFLPRLVRRETTSKRREWRNPFRIRPVRRWRKWPQRLFVRGPDCFEKPARRTCNRP